MKSVAPLPGHLVHITGRALPIVLALTLGACGGGSEAPNASPVHAVTFEVRASAAGTASISYRAPGVAATGVNGSLPWTYRTDAQAGDALFLSAQNDGSLKSVTVTIKVDGVALRTDTQSGAFVVASASAVCC